MQLIKIETTTHGYVGMAHNMIKKTSNLVFLTYFDLEFQDVI
jgi:hypothetical protein